MRRRRKTQKENIGNCTHHFPQTHTGLLKAPCETYITQSRTHQKEEEEIKRVCVCEKLQICELCKLGIYN